MESRGAKRILPCGAREYVKVDLFAPFQGSANGFPDGSNISMRPETALELLLTRARVVAHPPDIANCGKTV